MLSETDTSFAPTPDISVFMSLMDKFILANSDFNGGGIASSFYYYPLPNQVAVNMIWVREDEPPHVISIDSTSMAMTIQFPTLLDYDFSGSTTQFKGHIYVKVMAVIQIPYAFSDDSICIYLKELQFIDYQVYEESIDSFNQVNQLLGIAMDSDAQKIAIAALFTLLAATLEIEICEPYPNIGASISKACLEYLMNLDPLIIYNIGTSESALSKVIDQGVWIGIGGSESPPNNIANYLTTSDDFTFQISKEVIQPKLDEGAEEERKKYNQENDDKKIQSLKIALGNNEFVVDGRMKVIVDCWPDYYFDFRAQMQVTGLSPEGEILLSLGEPELDYDVSILDIVVSILTLGLFAIIQAVVVSVMKDLARSANFLSGSGNALNDLDTNLDLNDGLGTHIDHVFQRVEVVSSGIGYWGNLFVSSPCGTPLGEGLLWIDAVMKDIEDEIVAVRVRERGWKFRISEAIDMIEKNYIKFGNAYIVKRKSGRKYLRSYPNNTKEDNLDNLPKFEW